MSRYYFSASRQKIALLLLTGTVLAVNRSPRIHWRLIKALPKAWRAIDRRILRRVIEEFHKERLVDFKVDKNGVTTVVLTEWGQKCALRYKIDALAIPTPTRWDGKWRIVVFDIPEKCKKAREAFRSKIQELGFYQFQKSVWVYPYPCRDIIDFVLEIFEVRSYVQYLEVTFMTHDAKLRLHFNFPAAQQFVTK